MQRFTQAAPHGRGPWLRPLYPKWSPTSPALGSAGARALLYLAESAGCWPGCCPGCWPGCWPGYCWHVGLAVGLGYCLPVGMLAWLLAWLLAKTMYYMYAHTKAFSLCRRRTAAHVPFSCGKYVLWTWSTYTVRFLPAQTAVSPPRRRRGGGGEEKTSSAQRRQFC